MRECIRACSDGVVAAAVSRSAPALPRPRSACRLIRWCCCCCSSGTRSCISRSTAAQLGSACAPTAHSHRNQSKHSQPHSQLVGGGTQSRALAARRAAREHKGASSGTCSCMGRSSAALGAALAARRAAREHEGASSGTRSCIVAVSAAVRRHLLLLCVRVYASLLQAQPADTHVNAPREQGTDVP